MYVKEREREREREREKEERERKRQICRNEIIYEERQRESPRE